MLATHDTPNSKSKPNPYNLEIDFANLRDDTFSRLTT